MNMARFSNAFWHFSKSFNMFQYLSPPKTLWKIVVLYVLYLFKYKKYWKPVTELISWVELQSEESLFQWYYTDYSAFNSK